MLRSWRPLRSLIPHSVSEHDGEGDPCRVREKIARIVATAENQVTRQGAAQRVEQRGVIALTELHGDADGERRQGAGAKRHSRRRHTHPPHHHRGPESVAEDVADNRRQQVTAQMDDQADSDSANREDEIARASVRPASSASIALQHSRESIQPVG